MKRRNLKVNVVSKPLAGIGDAFFQIVISPIYMELTDFSEFSTGVLFTLFSLTFFLSAPIWGWLSDKFGRKKMMISTQPLTIIGIFLLFISQQNTFYLVIFSITLRGMGAISGTINNQMITAESTDKSKNGMGFMFGMMAFLYFGGNILGSVVVSFIDLPSLNHYLIVPVIVFSIDWMIKIIFLTETHRPGLIIKEKKSIGQIWKGIFKNSKISAAMIFLTLDVFVWGVTGAVYKAGLQDDFLVTVDDFALMQFVFSLCMMLFQIPAGKLTDKIGIKKSLIFSISFGLIIFPLFILMSFLWDLGYVGILAPVLITTQVLWAATASTFIPSEQMILTDLDESRKAESHGLVSFVRGFGAIPNGILGGYMIGNVHFIAPFIFSTIGIVFEIWYIVKNGHKFEKKSEDTSIHLHLKPSSSSSTENELM